MLFKCRGTHVLWVIWDPEFNSDIHFEIWPKERSISRQTSSNNVKFQNSKMSYKNITILSIFISTFQKKCHLFLCTTIKNAQFQKYDVITFTRFFSHCTVKNKHIAVEFCMLVLCIYPNDVYSVFFDNVKI